MNYVNAEKVLPERLIKELQQYIQGGYVYIPSQSDGRKKWGENSGYREYIQNRNNVIRKKYKNGATIKNLTEEFFLSVDSIKKIIYTKSK